MAGESTEEYYQNLAIEVFAGAIASSNPTELKRLIDNGLSLIRQPYSQKFVSMIKFFVNMPFVSGYIKKNIKLKPMDVLGFIQQKNPNVYTLLSTTRGQAWFHTQFREFMGMLQ